MLEDTGATLRIAICDVKCLLTHVGKVLACPGLRFLCCADLGQDLFRFSRLPLRVIQPLTCLTDVHLAETRLSFFDASDREIQPFTHFSKPFQLRIFVR